MTTVTTNRKEARMELKTTSEAKELPFASRALKGLLVQQFATLQSVAGG